MEGGKGKIEVVKVKLRKRKGWKVNHLGKVKGGEEKGVR